MLVRMRTRRTRNVRRKPISVSKKEKSIPWREIAKENIKKYTEIGLAIRGARHKAELTQAQLAKKLGISLRHVSEMEYGKRPVDQKMAHQLAEILDVNYKVFL